MTDETLMPNDERDLGSAKIVYILYLVSLIVGFTAIVGVVMAYIYRATAPAWLQSHYQFQIRTFWIGLLYALIGTLLLVFLVGWLVYMFLVIWWIIRCVKGISMLDKKTAYPNPTSWGF